MSHKENNMYFLTEKKKNFPLSFMFSYLRVLSMQELLETFLVHFDNLYVSHHHKRMNLLW